MTTQEVPLIERLFEAGNPRKLNDWEGQDGYYVAACRVSTADVPGLIDVVRKWNDPNWPGDEEMQFDEDDAELLPITAWRTLADLKASAAVESLIEILCEMDDEFDDWASEELPHVFGKIGETTIEPLTRVATDDGRLDLIRSIAARGLRRVALYYPCTRDRIVASLTEMMANAAPDHLDFCTTLLTELVELRAAEAAEQIERAFAANLLDVGMIGDWEYVRRELGVEGLGLPMPDHPHNCIEQFRLKMGFGIFSDRPLVKLDEIDADAVEAYHKQAHDTFSKSSEAKRVLERYGRLRWFQSLLEFGLSHLGETVDQMTPGTLQEFVLDYMPRKVSVEANVAAEVIGELTLFWQYLDRVYKLPSAKAVVAWLQTPDLVARLEASLSNPANFGMAKSMFMAGRKAGYDMTTQAGMNRFMVDYNRSLLAKRLPASRSVPAKHVGRNDPCPCGSGKKYKKCCLNTRQ